MTLTDAHAPELVVKPDVASRQLDAERAVPDPIVEPRQPSGGDVGPGRTLTNGHLPAQGKAKRFHGTAVLDTTRVGRDASRIAEEVISHLAGLVGATVTVTIEVDAEIPDGAPDHVVRTVTENSRTLKFAVGSGFEKE